MMEKYELEWKEANKLGRTGSMKRNIVVVDDEQAEQVPHRQGCCSGGS